MAASRRTAALCLLPCCAAAFQGSPAAAVGATRRPAVRHLGAGVIVGPATPLPAIAAIATATGESAACVQRSRSARMFSEPPPTAADDEDDVFAQISAQLTPMQKRLRGIGPFAMGVTTNGVTVLSALIAWFLTPPAGRIASLGGLLGGGVAGSLVSKSLTKQRKAVVPAVIADMVREVGLQGLKPADVAKLQERYDVNPAEFEAQLSEVYRKYLRVLLDSEENTPAQISELGQLRRGIGLRWNATEAVHEQTVQAFLKESELTLEAHAPDALPAELSALLWLTSALFSTSKGQASPEAVQQALQLDGREAARLVASVSTPFYRQAVTRAVGKYNRTEAPEKLRTARGALCLSEQAAAAVHAEIYDAQLRVLLPDGSARLDEAAMELLGELEGILQVRSASTRLQAVTQPLFVEALKTTLEQAYDSMATKPSAVRVWGTLALRQAELALPTEVAQASVTEEARRLLTRRLAAAAELHAKGLSATAQAELVKLVQYAQFLGEMMTVSGGFGTTPAADLASRYLGALALPAEAEASAAALQEAARGVPELEALQSLLTSMLCLSDPAYASARQQYATQLDATLDGGRFDEAAGARLDALAAQLGLPPALAQKLGVDAYYGWLVDTTETCDTSGSCTARLEACAAVRSTLRVGLAALGELHANTGVDEMLLSTVVGQLLDEEAPLTAAAEQTIAYLERQLGARPGVVAAILAGAADAD